MAPPPPAAKILFDARWRRRHPVGFKGIGKMGTRSWTESYMPGTKDEDFG